MGFSKAALKAERIHFNRVAGQLRRYYGIESNQYLEGVHTPSGYRRAIEQMKLDIEREQIELRVAEREARQQAELEQKEAAALFEINNIKAVLENDMVYVKSAYAQSDVRDSINIIFSTIDEAVYQHGAIDTVERLRPWASAADSRLNKLAFAIYDKYYNTNTGWYRTDDAGELGRSRYRADIERLAAELGVAAPPILF